MHSLIGQKLGTKKLDLEGGWIANISDENATITMTEAAEKISDETGVSVRIGVDVAANSLYKDGKYNYKSKQKDSGEQLDYILAMIDDYKLFYVEDAFNENDFDSFAELTSKAKNCLICGDDLFATNRARLERGLVKKACNSIIIKPNQVGTLSHTYDTIRLAKNSGYIPVVSHRSGETGDTTIASIAVAFSCPIIKIGIVGEEREAKLRELLKIEGTEKIKMNGGIHG
jgi:enolase